MNWTPKIMYTELGTGTDKTITFGSPPEGDPYNEQVEAIRKVNTSSNGSSQTQWSYNIQKIKLKFKFQSSSIVTQVKDFLENQAYQGGVFKYYPSSNESNYFTYELDTNKVSFDRPIPDGSGDFEYNFTLPFKRVIDKTYTEETVGAGRINETQFTIANNQSSVADITGLVFDSDDVGAAFITYWVQRKHTSPNSEVVEAGEIYVSYSSTDDWSLTRNSVGDAGLTITIDTDGQLQYTSSNISGDVDTSIMRFRANTIGVAE